MDAKWKEEHGKTKSEMEILQSRKAERLQRATNCDVGKNNNNIEEWCLLGCYAVWLL
jgi:hypothetical protein